MTPDEACAALYAEFLDQWAARTPLELEGEPFKTPAPGTTWARLSFRGLGGGQHTMGDESARIFRRRAAAVVNVFTPATAGMKTARTLAHAARAILEGRRVEGLDFLSGQVTETPLDKSQRNRQIDVVVECTYDETK